MVRGQYVMREELLMKKERLLGAFRSKRVLYVLCFMALNLIEFLRASQTGDIWQVAVNCTGFVVMIMIASAYPLKEFCTIPNGIYTVACVAVMAAVYFHWQQHVGEYLLWQVETAIVNIWWIGIIVKHLFKKIVVDKTMGFRPGVLGWLWIAMSMLMIASVSQRLWPLWYLLMFGAFYLTKYGAEDRKALWDGMINGTLISFFCIQIYAYGFRPYDEVRYQGAYANCNTMAMYYLIVYMMCLYKIHILKLRKAHWGRKFFYLVGAGGMLSFLIFTMGRTAWVAAATVTFLYGILVTRKLWEKKWRQVLYMGLGLVAALAVTFLPVFYSIRWLPTILHHPIWYDGEYSVAKVHSFDPADSEKYIELEEFLEVLLGRIAGTLKIFGKLDPLMLKAYAADDEMRVIEPIDVPWTDDQGIEIRLGIYKAYLEDMTWYGNTPDKGFYKLGNSGYQSWHAQNVWIQIGYYFGIPAGILLVVLTIVMLWHHGKGLKKGKENPYAIIPFFICVLFTVYGVTEVVWYPGQLIMFLIFFVQHPQLGEGEGAEMLVDQEMTAAAAE